jgi:pimeloyl-ACP methyl ester carboxylesterase
MDRRFSAIYRDSTPHCSATSDSPTVSAPPAFGYYAHYLPQLHPDSADVPLHLDRLAMIKVPVLVMKPACDYLAWSAVVGYRRAFPQAQLVMIPDAGHVAYLEQPVVYTNLERAFLAGPKLPLPTIDGTTIPDGYRGTVRDFSSRECCE